MAEFSFPEAIEEFLKEKNLLVLATTRGDGSPQVTPVWYLWENGRFMINALNGRAKVANMGRDPRVAFVIQDRQAPERYIQVRGRVISREGGATGHRDIDRLSERYSGSARFSGDPDHKTDRVSFYIAPEWYSSQGF